MDVAKKSDSIQLRYSMPTHDGGSTKCIQRSLYVIMSIQIISPLTHMVLGRVAIMYCKPEMGGLRFASHSWYIAIVLVM